MLPKWEGGKGEEERKEKEQASDVFKEVWQRCRVDETYDRLREEWRKGKADWEKTMRRDAGQKAA